MRDMMDDFWKSRVESYKSEIEKRYGIPVGVSGDDDAFSHNVTVDGAYVGMGDSWKSTALVLDAVTSTLAFASMMYARKMHKVADDVFGF